MGRSSGSYSHSSGSYSRGSQSGRSSSSYSRGSSPQNRSSSPSSYSRQSGSTARQGSSAARTSGSTYNRSGSTPQSRSSVSGTPATRANGTRPVNGSRSSGIKASDAASRAASRSSVTPGSTPRASSGNVRTNSSASRRPQAGTEARSFHGGSSPQSVRMGDNRRDNYRVAPRDRRPIPYNHPDRFWHGHHHCFGHRIDYLPHGYYMHYYWGRPYYYYDGYWYRHYHGCYYFCRPPFGYVYVPDVIDVAYAACRIAYYCAELNTYRTVNENAQTIADQNAIIAQNNATIAQQNAEIAMNTEKARAAYETANGLGLVQAYADASTEYFYDDGVFFTKSADGKYTVIVPPAGALVSELPDDYDTVTMDGKEYYKVDDTIFELTTVDGTAYFQVLGQLTGELADKYDLTLNK